MAKPIKETPYLKGKDASKFIANSKNALKIDAKTYEGLLDNYKKISALKKK